ncbi:MAG: divalent metal cation transporter [Chloroflexi bacterium]|nr:divalent metal cation transporter [Chloroflexota bacterium]
MHDLANDTEDAPAQDIAADREPPSAGQSPLDELQNEPNLALRSVKILGPGLITGASDDDPSGIGTYAVAGASLGYATLWTALLTFPLSATVQFVCAKIAMVSGRGLSGVIREHYPRWLLYPVVIALVVANTINIGADLGAIAAAVNLLVPTLPIAWMVPPIAALILGLQLWGSYALIARVFKWLSLALLAYIGSALLAQPDIGEVLRGTLVPTISFDPSFIATLVAILGTTISPYMFFWQAGQEVEEERSWGRVRLWQRRGASHAELKYRALDVNVGMFFSELVMYFIILGTAATLFKAGRTDITSAADAAQALRPLAGDLSGLLLAVGLIGAGFLAVPVLSGSAAYAVSEAMGWKHGLSYRPDRAREFYGVIVVATVIGMLINFVGINPIDALFWTAVINGVVAPPVMAIIMLVANNRRIMGDRVNNRWTNLLGWIATLLMGAAAIGLFLTWGH